MVAVQLAFRVVVRSAANSLYSSVWIDGRNPSNEGMREIAGAPVYFGWGERYMLRRSCGDGWKCTAAVLDLSELARIPFCMWGGDGWNCTAAVLDLSELALIPVCMRGGDGWKCTAAMLDLSESARIPFCPRDLCPVQMVSEFYPSSMLPKVKPLW